MASFDTVLFDLDGTLTNPRVGITDSIRHALREMGVEHDPAELEAAGADQLCASPADILACLARFS